MEEKHKLLVLHAVLLVRTVQIFLPKRKQMKLFDELDDDTLESFIQNFKNDESLRKYIEYYYDDVPNPWFYAEWQFDHRNDEDDRDYYTSCTNGDYGPSCPWNAPGMCVSDFI